MKGRTHERERVSTGTGGSGGGSTAAGGHSSPTHRGGMSTASSVSFSPSSWPLALLAQPPHILRHVPPLEAPASAYAHLPQQQGGRPTVEGLWSGAPRAVHGTPVRTIQAAVRKVRHQAGVGSNGTLAAARRGGRGRVGPIGAPMGLGDRQWEDGPAPAHVACLARLLRAAAPTGLVDRATFVAVMVGACASAASGALPGVVPLQWYTTRVLQYVNVPPGGVAAPAALDDSDAQPPRDRPSQVAEWVYVVDPARAVQYVHRIFNAFARAPVALGEGYSGLPSSHPSTSPPSGVSPSRGGAHGSTPASSSGVYPEDVHLIERGTSAELGGTIGGGGYDKLTTPITAPSGALGGSQRKGPMSNGEAPASAYRSDSAVAPYLLCDWREVL